MSATTIDHVHIYAPTPGTTSDVSTATGRHRLRFTREHIDYAAARAELTALCRVRDGHYVFGDITARIALLEAAIYSLAEESGLPLVASPKTSRRASASAPPARQDGDAPAGRDWNGFFAPAMPVPPAPDGITATGLLTSLAAYEGRDTDSVPDRLIDELAELEHMWPEEDEDANNNDVTRIMPVIPA